MDDQTPTKTCAECGKQPAGPGGVLCPDCYTAIDNFDFYGKGTPAP